MTASGRPRARRLFIETLGSEGRRRRYEVLVRHVRQREGGAGNIRSSLSSVRRDERITTSLQISPTTRSDDRITWRGLHSTGGIVAILEHVIHDQPNKTGHCVDAMPRELDRICLQGLSRKRDDRQQSAMVLGEEIQAWLADQAERKRTEQERERFFNLSVDLLTILNAEGRLAQTNPAWESVLGWSARDLQSKQDWDLIDTDDHQHAIKNHERIISGEALTEVEYRCLCKDGCHRWILWNARLIPGESSIYLVGRDSAERKRTEQTFHDLLESVPDAMVVINDSRIIVLVNTRLEQLFDYAREELLGNAIEIAGA